MNFWRERTVGKGEGERRKLVRIVDSVGDMAVVVL